METLALTITAVHSLCTALFIAHWQLIHTSGTFPVAYFQCLDIGWVTV